MKFPGWLALAGVALAPAFSADRTVSTGVVEEIVAKVNGDIITRADLDRARKQMEDELRRVGGPVGPAARKELQERMADNLRERIDELLLVQKGKELNVSVDSEVSKYIAEIQKQTGIADTDKFQQSIREQTGMPFEDYKAEIKNGMLRQRVIGQEVFSRINVPRAELEKYYNEHKSEFVREEQVFLSEIFISTEGKDAAGRAVAEKKAKDLAARARKGEKFWELARDNSDSLTAKDGGNLGGWKRGSPVGLDKQLEEISFAHDRGYITDPILRPNPPGFLILKIDEKFKAGQASFEEVENQVRDKLLSPRTQPAVREYLTRLREQAFLEIKEGYQDTGAAPGKDTAWKDPATLTPKTISAREVKAVVHHKRLLWVLPLPGTHAETTGTSSSR